VEHLLTLLEDTRSAAKVHLRWRESDAAVPMLVVVPSEKSLAEARYLVEGRRENGPEIPARISRF
jgi:hypothetical protein